MNLSLRGNVAKDRVVKTGYKAQSLGQQTEITLAKKLVLQTITHFTIEFTKTMNMTTLQHLVKNSPENKF